jgi:hypothetical protein
MQLDRVTQDLQTQQRAVASLRTENEELKGKLRREEESNGRGSPGNDELQRIIESLSLVIMSKVV